MHLIVQLTLEQMLHKMAHYHDYGVLMQQQVADMTQSQQPLQHEVLMMQQQMAILPLQHQTASMTQHNEA